MLRLKEPQPDLPRSALILHLSFNQVKGKQFEATNVSHSTGIEEHVTES